MRRLSLILLCVLSAGAVAARAGADDVHTYKVEIYNAFGLVPDSEVRVAGVRAGTITDLDVNEKKRAILTVEIAGELATLGEDTQCESSPQSLIAEYFLDCQPAGKPLPEGGTIPASQVKLTVQPDIVANTMREPFRRRLALLINEFGTALAGNPENLREAVRLGAPALTDLEEATGILARQAKMVRAFNVHSEKVSGELADYRDEIVDFIDETEDVASTAIERGEDVARGFDLFDDYVGRLQPTLAQLRDTAEQQTPLLRDLGAAAPGLHRLSEQLPDFQRASEVSLESLGEASVVGERALRKGRDELKLLAEAGENGPVSAEMLADVLRDLDDPRRAVEINDAVEDVTGRTSEEPGTRNTKGYTGLESLLNYPYFQALGINQFDQYGHALHVNLYEYQTGPCGSFSSGRDLETGEPGIPDKDGGTTTEFSEIADCATWLGPNQPGINEDLNLPPYHPSVCPEGTAPEAAEALCSPDGATTSTGKRSKSGRKAVTTRKSGSGGGKARDGDGGDRSAGGPGSKPGSESPTPNGLGDVLDDAIGLPGEPLDGGGLGLGRSGNRSSSTGSAGLLDFLFGP